MVHLVSRPTGNAFVFFDASNLFLIFLIRHTPLHFIKVSLPAPCSRPCTSPKSIFSWTNSCAGAAHAHEEPVVGASSAAPHLNTSAGSTHPGPRNCTAHQGKNKGGHHKWKLYFYGKWKIKGFSVIRNDEGLRTWHRVCRCIFLKGYLLELNFKLMIPILILHWICLDPLNKGK